MMIGMNGRSPFPLMRRATSMPSMAGIITSRRMRSGGASATEVSAAAPSRASVVSYPHDSRRARRSSTLSSWSSTMRMRADASPSPCIVLSEEALDFGYHGARFARLREIPVAPHLHRLLAIGRERVRRERDDGDRTRLGVVLQHLRRLPAVDDRDRDVHQDQIRALRARLRDPFL